MKIESRVVAHSVHKGKEIVTFENEGPRLILAQVNTHRALSKNAASTRAIPLKAQVDTVGKSPYFPLNYRANQRGMVGGEPLNEESTERAMGVINGLLEHALVAVEELDDIGLHKQSAGRYLEPWMGFKQVMTGTEFNNWFHLRHHEDAQDEIDALAKSMWKALKASTPKELSVDGAHVPYYFNGWWEPSGRIKKESCGVYVVDIDEHGHTLEEALIISSSCCAQVSYRTLDTSFEKALNIYKKLIETNPVHASPVEHQAWPMVQPVVSAATSTLPFKWEEGVTHMDRKSQFWSGNFQGWIQHRQIINNHYKEG